MGLSIREKALITAREFTRQRVERSILPVHRTYLRVTDPHLRCSYVSACTYIYIYILYTFIEMKIPEGVRAKTFSLASHYYLIRALTRAYESPELYYNPESYTRTSKSMHTRLILLSHIILNAHGWLYYRPLNRKWFELKLKCKQVTLDLRAFTV